MRKIQNACREWDQFLHSCEMSQYQDREVSFDLVACKGLDSVSRRWKAWMTGDLGVWRIGRSEAACMENGRRGKEAWAWIVLCEGGLPTHLSTFNFLLMSYQDGQTFSATQPWTLEGWVLQKNPCYRRPTTGRRPTRGINSTWFKRFFQVGLERLPALEADKGPAIHLERFSPKLDLSKV